MTVHASTQVPYYVHLMLSQILAWTCRASACQAACRGGFGCRTETLNIELIAALLARKVGGAVRIVVNREETFITHRGRPENRHPAQDRHAQGRPHYRVECECDQRGGAHSGYGVVTILYSGSMLYAIYDLHNVKYVGRRVLTNTPPVARFAATARSTCASHSRACLTRWPASWADRSRCGAQICFRRRPSPRTT